jgi:hypothetical protein
MFLFGRHFTLLTFGGRNMERRSKIKWQPMDSAAERNKAVSITSLFIGSIAIILTGVIFCINSILNNISFMVLGSGIHGSVFGLVVTFLGIRYFVSVRKLKTEVYKKSSRFSWSNFKSDKSRKGYQ